MRPEAEVGQVATEEPEAAVDGEPEVEELARLPMENHEQESAGPPAAETGAGVRRTTDWDTGAGVGWTTDWELGLSGGSSLVLGSAVSVSLGSRISML